MTAGGPAAVSVAATGARDSSWLRRLGALVVPSLLVVGAVLQSPGRVTFDSDLPLALRPMHLLGRALHLWSAENGFGGVGDQTYGFLFPVGPFFALAEGVGLPPWLVQRLWCGLLLVLAYEGARRLVGRMISPLPVVGVVAGLAWALSPRMLTVVGAFSTEALTVALVPWLLLPLVCYLDRDPRRAAWLSGLVVLGLGAANAGATVAVLPVPVLYLLTRTTSRRQRLRSLGWWSAGVGLACAWWIGPLLLLGAYSPPFTDWVESARTTTDPVTALAALRGTTDWVAYVGQGSTGFWPAAWDLATSRGLLVATTAVAVLGLAGLTGRRLPERRFLLLTALLGFAVLTLGHQAHPGSLVSSQVRSLLDGPAVPFRNVYKLDPVLRLPLVLGLAHLLSQVLTRRLRFRVAGPLVAAVGVAAVLATALPMAQGTLRPGPSFEALPSWWHSAADYVAQSGGTGRTLVVPEATAGQYDWGRTVGEPLEVLGKSPWAVRNQVPLTPAGNTRLVDAVETTLESGRGSPALAPVLARSGVSSLLVRNDLDPAASGTIPAARVRQALTRSPGLHQVAAFGPVRPRGSLGAMLPALEVWAVDREVDRVRATPLSEVVALAGGPEDLLPLLEQGVVAPDQPTVLAGQAPAGDWPGPRVATDGLQRRERSFGRVHDALGPLLTADDGYRQVRPVHDLLPFDAPGQQTVATYDGLTSLTASSSAAYVDGFGRIRPGSDPAAAVDGDLSTAWSSGSLRRPVGQWLQLRLAGTSDARSVSLALVSRSLLGPLVTKVRLDTDRGSVVRSVTESENLQQLALPPGDWSRLRITVAGVVGSARFGVVGIREVQVPGLTPRRSALVRGTLPPGPAPAGLLFRTADPTGPCVLVDGTQRCDAGFGDAGDEPGQLQRTFSLPQEDRLRVTGTVLPQQGPALERLLAPLAPHLAATASSTLDAGPVGAHAAVDGDVTTSWIASPFDLRPTLTLQWPAPKVIRQLRIAPSTLPGTSRPGRVHVHTAAGDRDAPIGTDGVARFAGLRTDRLELTFPTSGALSPLPLGLGEVRVVGAGVPSLAPDPAGRTGTFCGFGPTVDVDGRLLQTQVTGTVGDLLASRPLSLATCGRSEDPVALAGGTHRIQASSTQEFRIRSLALTPAEARPAAAAPRTVTVRHWGQVHRSVSVAPGAASLLSVPEAASAGWRATLGGRALRPLTVDGWQQGWVVPEGQGGVVDLSFRPDTAYRWWLLVGLLAALLLLALAVRAVRRPLPPPLALEGRAGQPRRQAVTALVLAVGCTVVGGVPCLLGLLLAAAAVRFRRRSWAAVLCWGAPLVAGLLVLQRQGSVPALQAQSITQALCLVGVGALAAQLLSGPASRPGAGSNGS